MILLKFWILTIAQTFLAFLFVWIALVVVGSNLLAFFIGLVLGGFSLALLVLTVWMTCGYLGIATRFVEYLDNKLM